MREGRVTLERFTSLIQVGDRPFHPSAPGAHHRLRREIAAAPPWGGFRAVLREWCAGRALIAHNIPTERGLLRRMAPLEPWGPWIDTLRVCRALFPSCPSFELGSIVASLGLLARIRQLLPAWTPHDALSDAVASAVIVEHILTLPGWGDVLLAQFASLRPPRSGKGGGHRPFGPTCPVRRN